MREVLLVDSGIREALLLDSGIREVLLVESGIREVLLVDSGIREALLVDSGIREVLLVDSGIREALLVDSGIRDVLPVESGIRKNFACGIQNHGLWNLESHLRLASGIQVPPVETGIQCRESKIHGVESVIRDNLGFPYIQVEYAHHDKKNIFRHFNCWLQFPLEN